MAKGKSTKGQTAIYNTLHIRLQIEQHEPHWKLGVHSVPAPLVAPVVLASYKLGDKSWFALIDYFSSI